MKKLIAPIIALSLLLASTMHVDAQRTISPALALARLCQSEASWTCWESGDGYAIHEVLLRGAAREGWRYTTFARAYASRLFGARTHGVERLQWSGELNEAGTTPPSWPRFTRRRRGETVTLEPHAPWSAFRARWLLVLDRAREVSQWTLDDVDEWTVCDSEVHDWGGRVDRERAVRLGLINVECGETANDFYARPSLVSTD